MDQTDTLERVKRVLVNIRTESAPIKADDILLTSDLRNGWLALDSIDFVKMVVALEEAFGFIAEDEDFLMSNVNTVADVVELVRARQTI